jgi:hypothetical protein
MTSRTEGDPLALADGHANAWLSSRQLPHEVLAHLRRGLGHKTPFGRSDDGCLAVESLPVHEKA